MRALCQHFVRSSQLTAPPAAMPILHLRTNVKTENIDLFITDLSHVAAKTTGKPLEVG